MQAEQIPTKIPYQQNMGPGMETYQHMTPEQMQLHMMQQAQQSQAYQQYGQTQQMPGQKPQETAPGSNFDDLQAYYYRQQEMANNMPKHIIDDVDGKSEDEGINDYKQGGYHPVYVGEVLIDRYVIIQKLGWGHFSTVWLAKDFKYNTYVAIKVQKSASHYLEAAYDEVELLQKAAKHSMDKQWLSRLKQHYRKTGKKNFTREDCHVVQ